MWEVPKGGYAPVFYGRRGGGDDGSCGRNKNLGRKLKTTLGCLKTEHNARKTQIILGCESGNDKI